MGEITDDQFLAALRATQHFSGARSQFEEMYTAARALEPAPVDGDAVEVALDAWHNGWRNCPSELKVKWLRIMPAAIAAADAVRGRAYVEWRDDMEKAKTGRSVWVGQRGAIGVYSTWWQENQWMGIPRGYAQPDCWAEIVPPPPREKPATTGAGGSTEFTDYTVDGVPTRVRYTSPDDLPTRTFRVLLAHVLAMDARVLWPVEDSGELRALADEWEKRDG